MSQMREDLAHDDGVCELCDEAAWAAAVRAGEDVDGEDAAHRSSAQVERREWERAEPPDAGEAGNARGERARPESPACHRCIERLPQTATKRARAPRRSDTGGIEQTTADIHAAPRDTATLQPLRDPGGMRTPRNPRDFRGVWYARVDSNH